MAIDLALSRYGGSSSRRISVGSPLSRLIHAVPPGRLERRVVGGECVFLTELAGDFAPDAVGHVGFTAGKGNDPHLGQGLGTGEPRKNRCAELRMVGQHSQRNQVMGLATAHRLGELEHGLLGLPFQAAKSLGQEGPHAVGDEVLLEETRAVDLPIHQVVEVQDGIAFGDVENAVARRAEVRKRLDGHDSSA